MSWLELLVNVECPHCGFDNNEHVMFYTGSGDREGCPSNENSFECFKCYKPVHFKAYVRYETEVTEIRKRPSRKNLK